MIARSKESILRKGIIASTGRSWRAAKAFSINREKKLVSEDQLKLSWDFVSEGIFTKLNLVFQEMQKDVNGGKVLVSNFEGIDKKSNLSYFPDQSKDLKLIFSETGKN